MKTIPKNRKNIVNAIFANASHCKKARDRASNSFAVPVQCAKDALYAAKFSKLISLGDNRYRVQYGRFVWFDFTSTYQA